MYPSHNASAVMLVLIPWTALSNYPYRPLQMYQSHELSDKGSNHNAKQGKLSRLMQVMSHVLFLSLRGLGGGGGKTDIQLLAQMALIVSSLAEFSEKPQGKARHCLLQLRPAGAIYHHIIIARALSFNQTGICSSICSNASPTLHFISFSASDKLHTLYPQCTYGNTLCVPHVACEKH